MFIKLIYLWGDEFMATSTFTGTIDGFMITSGKLMAYVGESGDIKIPNQVVEIADGVFRNRADLTSVLIQNDMVRIGKYAFYNCENLTSVKILGNVQEIEDYAFYACKNLKSNNIIIPNIENMKKIGDYAFCTNPEESCRYGKNMISSSKKKNSKFKKVAVTIGVLSIVVIGIIAAVSVFTLRQPLSNGMSRDESKEVLEEGIAYYDSGDYKEAIECLKKLPPDSRQYDEAQTTIEKSITGYRNDILTKVKGYTKNEEYETALELLKNAEDVLPDDEKLTSIYHDIYSSFKKFMCTNAIDEADKYIKNDDYAKAISVLLEANDKIGNDEEISAKLSVYKQEFVDTTLDSAKAAYQTDGYEGAVAKIKNGLSVLRGDQALSEALSHYEELKPLPLSAFDSYEDHHDGIIQLTECEDREGNVYTDCYSEGTYHYGPACSSKYLLNNQYSKMTGKFVMLNVEDVKCLSNPMWVTISGDDHTILYHEDLEVGEKEICQFEIDISNTKWLTIELSARAEGSGSEQIAALVSVNFEKATPQ